MKILLVQTSFLGDTILSTPVIAGLHKIYPGCELWMLTTPISKPLVERDPLVSGVITYDKRGSQAGVKGLLALASDLRDKKFDMVYSLHRSFRTALLLYLARIPQRICFNLAIGAFLYTRSVRRHIDTHEVMRNLSLLFDDISPAELDNSLRLFAPPAEDLSEVNSKIGSASYIVLVPGSVWATKRWTVSGFREVAEHFLGLGKSVVIVGAPNEKEICQSVSEELSVVDLSGQTSISELVGVIASAELVVCNDSMALHVASSFKVPSVAIFCATSPHFGFGPWKNKATVVEKLDLACKPCRRHGSNKCPTGTELCMTGVRGEQVIKAAEEFL